MDTSIELEISISSYIIIFLNKQIYKNNLTY